MPRSEGTVCNSFQGSTLTVDDTELWFDRTVEEAAEEGLDERSEIPYVPVPDATEACFRVGAFRRSFLGRMVSVLGFNRTDPLGSPLPAPGRSTFPPVSDACGIELTVSVSTVMFSLAVLALGVLRDVYDPEGANLVREVCVLIGAVGRLLRFPSLLLPLLLSLPLSVTLLARSAMSSCDASADAETWRDSVVDLGKCFPA